MDIDKLKSYSIKDLTPEQRSIVKQLATLDHRELLDFTLHLSPNSNYLEQIEYYYEKDPMLKFKENGELDKEQYVGDQFGSSCISDSIILYDIAFVEELLCKLLKVDREKWAVVIPSSTYPLKRSETEIAMITIPKSVYGTFYYQEHADNHRIHLVNKGVAAEVYPFTDPVVVKAEKDMDEYAKYVNYLMDQS